jgi:hypothetical protein
MLYAGGLEEECSPLSFLVECAFVVGESKISEQKWS